MPAGKASSHANGPAHSYGTTLFLTLPSESSFRGYATEYKSISKSGGSISVPLAAPLGLPSSVHVV